MSDTLLSFTAAIRLATECGALRTVVFSQPRRDLSPLRRVGRPRLFRGATVLAVEDTHKDGKVHHSTVAPENIEQECASWLADYRQCNLLTEAGEASLRISKKGKLLESGVKRLTDELSRPADFTAVIEGLDRKKAYLLRGDEPFLRALGITDATGRIHDKKQAKFRQINRFLEYVRDVLPALPEEGPLLIFDLCCGKSYLSFALYHYLTATCGRTAEMLCIDRKEDVIRFCAAMAEQLHFSGMHFRADDIRHIGMDRSPDMVVSLHACDIATDIVLNTAIRLRARVILSTPCCHRYLNDRLSAPLLQFVTDEPQLRNKMCEALTDGLRLLRLRAAGYQAHATELIDPEDTPKNTLLRATLLPATAANQAAREKAEAQYRATLQALLGEGTDAYLEGLC